MVSASYTTHKPWNYTSYITESTPSSFLSSLLPQPAWPTTLFCATNGLPIFWRSLGNRERNPRRHRLWRHTQRPAFTQQHNVVDRNYRLCSHPVAIPCNHSERRNRHPATNTSGRIVHHYIFKHPFRPSRPSTSTKIKKIDAGVW